MGRILAVGIAATLLVGGGLAAWRLTRSEPVGGTERINVSSLRGEAAWWTPDESDRSPQEEPTALSFVAAVGQELRDARNGRPFRLPVAKAKDLRGLAPIRRSPNGVTVVGTRWESDGCLLVTLTDAASAPLVPTLVVSRETRRRLLGGAMRALRGKTSTFALPVEFSRAGDAVDLRGEREFGGWQELNGIPVRSPCGPNEDCLDLRWKRWITVDANGRATVRDHHTFGGLQVLLRVPGRLRMFHVTRTEPFRVRLTVPPRPSGRAS